MTIISRLAISACAALASGLTPAALAETFPARPVRVVVGPGSDFPPRIIGQKLAGVWGQQVVVDQRPGGGGAIALDISAKSAPDGYTWLISTAAFTINASLYPGLPYSLVRDFAPVTLLATATFYLLVNPSVPANSVTELIQLARAKPGQLNYSSAGTGTPPHIAGEMFKIMAGINIVHVPYKSAIAATTGLLGGHVQLSFQYAPTALPQVKSGKLRALAVSSAKRSLTAPELPTVAESGLTGFEVIGWNGVHVPAGTPGPIIAKLSKDIGAALALPDVRERMLGAGLEAVGNTPEEFAAFVKTDLQHWARLIEQTGIRAE
jgi:tripartite-type tricarboxylate transporter receptor subunit TctC